MMILAVVSNPLHEFIQEMARKVEEKPDGAIGTEFDPSAPPGKIPRLIEGLQLGAVEFFGRLPQGYQILEAPGVFGSPLHAHKTVAGPAFRQPFLNFSVSGAIEGANDPTSCAAMNPVWRIPQDSISRHLQSGARQRSWAGFCPWSPRARRAIWAFAWKSGYVKKRSLAVRI